MSSRVTALLGDGELSGVEVENVESGEKTVLAVSGLFVAIGHESDNEAFRGLAETDAAGWFTAGEDGEETLITPTPTQATPAPGESYEYQVPSGAATDMSYGFTLPPTATPSPTPPPLDLSVEED